MHHGTPINGTTVTLLALTTLSLGFGAGWLSRRCYSDDDTGKEVKSQLCECGFDLTGKDPSHITQHLSGRQHRVNLHRAGRPILVTAKVNEYRAAIATHVLPTDVVLEVGCAEGLTTQRLAQRAKVAIGIDQMEVLIERGLARIGRTEESTTKPFPPKGGWDNLHLKAADAFDTKALIEIVDRALGIEPTEKVAPKKSSDPLTRKEKRKEKCENGPAMRKHKGKVTKIWLDISGSRELRTVVQLISVLEALFQPELMVVKSDHLKNLTLRTFLPSSDIPGLTHAADLSPYVIC